MTEVKVPHLPESVTDATIIVWHKKSGDFVKRDENLVDLETDKVVLEVPSPSTGVLKEILKQLGAVVKAEDVLAIIEENAAENNIAVATTETEKNKKESSSTATALSSVETDNKSLSAGPSARRLAREHDINLQAVSGTGKAKRVTAEDVLKQFQSQEMKQQSSDERIEKRVPLSRLRARIAERLLAVQHNAAILTTFNEVNLEKVMALRTAYKDSFEKKYNIRLGFMSFFTKAVIAALKLYPTVNASIDGNDIIYHGYFDIGIAVSTERGLVVPIIRDADKMNFATLERAIANYGKKARDGQITIEDMKGGTFTITNGGVFGSLLSTPIINPPQSAILGMHKIEERAVVENGQIVIRPMMYLALSYDHRIIDGKESVGFLVSIKENLEDPSRLLLEI